MTDVRHQRLCDVCGQLDDNPRHVQAVGPDHPGAVPSDAFINGLPDGVPARAVAELMDPTTLVRHMDCCGAAGCSLCQDVLAAAGAAHGDALTEALVSGVADSLSGSQAQEA